MPIPASVALAYLAMSTLWTANDPFVGKWKLDVSRTRAVDQMQVEAAGPNTYAFRFEGGPVETIIADGTDQPGASGTTLSATTLDSHTWKIVRKQAGRTLITATWKLSEDGRTLHDAFTGVQPDGSTPTADYAYRRRSGKAGFTGVWESTDVPVSLAYELDIRPYERHGLSFITPAAGSVKDVTFDGRDHPVAGAVQGATAAGHRARERVLEITDKAQGKLIDTRTLRLSPDGKTLTLTLRFASQATPNVLVFERE